MCLMLSGAASFFTNDSFLSDVVIMAGSSFYVFSSVLRVFLWRDEQFGLTYLPAMNEVSRQPPEDELRSSANGHGRTKPPRFSWRGFVFINIYCIISVVS